MKTFLDIVIDYSNSMGNLNQNGKSYLLPDGTTRFSLAKRILTDVVIPKLDYASEIRVWTFYGLNKGLKETKIYSGRFDNTTLLTTINALADPVNTGSTPISAALDSSLSFLKGEKESNDNKIILVTDGEEDPGSNFFDVIKKALSEGINFGLFIVGIAQNKEIENVCKEAVQKTGGTYVNLESAVYDKAKLMQELRPVFVTAVSNSFSNSQLRSGQMINNAINQKPTIAMEDFGKVKGEFIAIVEQQNKSISLLQKHLTNTEAGFETTTRSQTERIANLETQLNAFSHMVDKETLDESIVVLAGEIESTRAQLKKLKEEINASVESHRNKDEEKNRQISKQFQAIWFLLALTLFLTIYLFLRK